MYLSTKTAICSMYLAASSDKVTSGGTLSDPGAEQIYE